MSSRPKVVTLGGGHGLYAMLTALRRLDVDLTAVVTVADDGGSSGRLRRENPAVLPPGDLRMALAALAGQDERGDLWQRTFQHRFAGEGALTGHPVGNLVLVGLFDVLGDMVKALDAAGAMLGCVGRVLPMARTPMTIVGQVAGLEEDPNTLSRIRGQVAVASTPGQVRSVALEPADVRACPEAVRAIAEADIVTLGPGSWFTSVLPHLLVPELAQALITTPARRLVVLNLAAQPGETEGFSPEQHLHVLSSHAPEFRVDTVLADQAAVPVPGRLSTAAEAIGASLELAQISDASAEPRHDPGALAAVMARIIGAYDATPPVSAMAEVPTTANMGRSARTNEEAARWR